MYQPLVSNKSLFITDGFQARYPSLMDTVRKCLASNGCRWVGVASLDNAATHHERDLAKPVTQRRPMDMIVLALAAEKASAAFFDKKWIMTVDAFLICFAKEML